jgi:beta-lactamase class A
MENLDKKLKRIYKISLRTGILCCLVVMIALGASFWLGYARAINWTRKAVFSIQPVRENNQQYKLIYPLLYYSFGEAGQFFEDKTLGAKINSYIQSQYNNQNAQSISVFFRDYSNGRWAGVNQNYQYHPGSMMKVIIMMGYFREAEPDPSILNKTLVYTKEVDKQTNDVGFSLGTNLVIGQSYTVSSLLKNMIGNSDNGAETLLLDNVNTDILNQAYIDLGISSPDSAGNDYTISAAQYSNFLRILYNSTYLSEQFSEQALSIMSQSSYKDGIRAGVPANVVVAQKYGERVDTSGNILQAIELHDCGIVYDAAHPYALCIMTKKNATTTLGSDDEKKLTGIIKDISSIVYNYVTSH